jgi:hypothetical protein
MTRVDAEHDRGRPLLGLLLVAVLAVAVGLAVFLPLFLSLPVWSPWRYTTWAAAFVGPLAGAKVGEWLTGKLRCPPRTESARQITVTIVFAFLIAALLPYISRT